MKKTEIYNLNECPINSRNGTYGGKAGDKEGITINGAPWIVKYSKSTKGMRGVVADYTTSPLSEYIGSNVYRILGIPAHETLLGIRNEKLVVACKDFCKTEGALREIRTLKNVYNKELAMRLEMSLSSTSDSHVIALEDMLIHLDYNPILKNVPFIKDRFWEQMLVDVLINNNDRNSGNWGVLYEDGAYRVAPVFDNGAAFSNKLPDFKLLEMLENSDKFEQSIWASRTIYSFGGKELFAKDIINIEESRLYEAAKRIIPVVLEKMPEIEEVINGIPERFEDMPICSQIRKDYYVASMQLRLSRFLLPVLDKAESQQSRNIHKRDKAPRL